MCFGYFLLAFRLVFGHVDQIFGQGVDKGLGEGSTSLIKCTVPLGLRKNV